MRIAIISGASSGIGKAFARELDALGLDELWLIGRNEARLNELKSELKTHAVCHAFDLTDSSAINELQAILRQGKHTIEYLVLSAGVGCNGAFEEISYENASQMIDVNCTALTLLTKIVLPFVCEGGHIINVASSAGFLPQPDFAVYAATKAYVISFSRALRQELRKRKIKVTAVCPGPVDTLFFQGLENVKEYKKKYLISPEKVARGALKASRKNKAIYTPTLSMKLVHLISKILPTSWVLRFYK